MIIRTTTDPITLRDVPDAASHPCVYEGDGDNGLEIYFETEANRQEDLSMGADEDDHRIILQGNDVDEGIDQG